MKKVIMILLLGMFLFSFASAVEFNNVKNYDKDSKTITLKESLLGKDIATVTLNTDFVTRVPLGYQQIIKYTINSKKDYSNLIQSLKTYNPITRQEISKQIDLKYQTFFYANITDYAMVCTDTDNKTYWNDCRDVVTGYHQQLTEKWEPLTNYNAVKGQTLVVGGFTYVSQGDVFDWVQTIAGKEMPEFAIWEGYLDTNLTIAYSLNESDGGTDFDDQSNASNNATMFNNVTRVNPGVYNNSIILDGSNDYVQSNANVGNAPATDNSTLCAWINPADTTDRYILALGASSGGNGFVLKINGASNNILLDKFGANIASNRTVTATQWTHICLVYSGNNDAAQFYINGTPAGTGTLAVGSANSKLVIGADPGSPPSFGNYKGSIDEVYLWNRTLNSSEVFLAYNSTFNERNTAVTLSINITRPQNTTYTSLTQELNVTNSTDVSYWFYNLNGGGNITFTPNTTITAVSGYNSLIVYANDSTDTWAVDTEYFSVPLSVNITYPQNLTYTTIPTTLNWTNNTVYDKAYYNLNGAANTSITSNVSITPIQGLNTIILYANDSGGVFTIDTEVFFVDSLAPNLTIISPLNGSTYTEANITLNLSSNDTNGVNLTWYNWNSSTNYTYNPSTFTVFSGEEWLELKNYHNGSGYSPNHDTENINNSAQNITLNIPTGFIPETSISIWNGYAYFAAAIDGTNNIYYQVNASNISQIINQKNTSSRSYTTPLILTISGNTYVYWGEAGGTVYQSNATNITQTIATYSVGGTEKGFTGNGTWIYVPGQNSLLYQLNASNISILGSVGPLGGTGNSMPIMSNDNRYVYVGSASNKFFQFNASNLSTGSINYSTTSPTNWKAAVSDDYVYFTSETEKKVYQNNASNIATNIFTYTTTGNIHAPGVICGDFFYQNDLSGNVYKLNKTNISQLITSASFGGSMILAMSCSDRYLYTWNDNAAYLDYLQLNLTNLALHSTLNLTDVNDVVPVFANGYFYGGETGRMWQMGNGSTGSTPITIINFSIGINNLNVWSNDSFGNLQYNLSTFTVNVPGAAPVVNLVSPANATVFPTTSVSLVGNVTSSLPIVNVSFLINANIVSTNTSAINNSNYTYSTTLSEGSYNWAVQACNNESTCTTTSNRSFTVVIPSPTITLISPADGLLTNNSSTILIASVSSGQTIANVSFLLNATIVSTNSSGINNSQYSYSTTLSDGNYNWSVRSCNNLNNCTTTSNRTFTIDTSGPVLTITSPPYIIDFSQYGDIQFFNYTISESNPDVCYYDYNNTNQAIVSTSGLNTTWLDGNYTKLYEYSNPVSNTSFGIGSNNKYLTVSQALGTQGGIPSSYIKTYINLSGSTTTNGFYNLTVNYTSGGSCGFGAQCVDIRNSSSILLHMIITNSLSDYRYVTQLDTIRTYVGCSSANLTLNLNPYISNLTLYANDTFGNSASLGRNWSYNVLLLNETYESPVVETSSTDFNVYYSYNASSWSSASATLYYNGTAYSGTTYGTGNILGVSRSVFVPSVGSETNVTFYWNLSLTNTTGTFNYLSNEHNQTISPIVLNYCLYSNETTITFNTYQTLLPNQTVNATMQISWNISDSMGENFINRSFQDLTESNNTWSFCMFPSDGNYSINAIIEVDATGYTQTNHYLVNASLNGTANENITLYLLSDNSSTLTELIVNDFNYVIVPDAYITIQRYDIGTDSYYNVGMARTSYAGKDLAYLEWYNTFYKFIVVVDGEVVGEFGPSKISETPQVLRLGLNPISNFTKFDDLTYSLIYNNATQNFVLTFVKPSGDVDMGCLRVIKRNVTNDYNICEVCDTSNSATLYCNIASAGNGTFIADFYATGSFAWIDTLIKTIGAQNALYELIGNDNGTGFAIILAGVVLSFFLISPAVAVFGMILGMLATFALGFQPFDTAAFLGIVLLGGAIIWAVKR